MDQQRPSHRPKRSLRSRVLRLLPWLALLVLVEILLYNLYFYTPVSVNGQSMLLPRGTALREIPKRANVKSGDLVSVSGRIIKKANGRFPTFLLNGHVADATMVVGIGDAVVVRRGADVTEPVVGVVTEIKAEERFEGSGPFVVPIVAGRPGLRRTLKGKLSGETAGTKVIRQPVASLYRRQRVRPNKVVALTFDDGPSLGATPRVLKILKRYRVKATFFVLGVAARRYRGLVTRAAKEGHLIGNHTVSHPDMRRLNGRQILSEVRQTTHAIRQATGEPTSWFRPPYGAVNARLVTVLKKSRYRIVMWTVDTNDWRRPPARIIMRRAVTGARSGGIILMHDGGGAANPHIRDNTVRALPKIIEGLRKRGYTFVTVDQLPKLPRVIY